MEEGDSGDLSYRYQRWKDVAPVLYDWITPQNLVWPSLSCRWGSQTYKNKQQIYVSEQTDGSVPNTLVVATAQVGKPRVSAAEHIAKFDKERGSSNLSKQKTIIHPGEVNRIRELPQNSNFVATHSDVPEVYVWNLESQPNQKPVRGGRPAIADLVLEGHTADAPFALDMSPTGSLVLSGGTDCKVVLWSIEDHTTSGVARKTGGRRKSAAGLGTTVSARSIFSGHTATVEDVCFNPSSVDELCSVGDDKALLIWDARTSTSAPVLQMLQAHDDDVHCVDWSARDSNLILTGSADNTVKLFDRRKMDAENGALHIFKQHSGSVLCVQWHPESASIFASSAEDGLVNCWDYSQVGKAVPKGRFGMDDSEAPAELFFQHRGHRSKVVDFQWNPQDPWVLMSASEDVELEKGGGTIQIWKMNEVVYKGGDAEKEELMESVAFQRSVVAAKPKPTDAKRRKSIVLDEEEGEPAKKTKLDTDAAEAREEPTKAVDADVADAEPAMASTAAVEEMPVDKKKAEEVTDEATPMDGVERSSEVVVEKKVEEEVANPAVQEGVETTKAEASVVASVEEAAVVAAAKEEEKTTEEAAAEPAVPEPMEATAAKVGADVEEAPAVVIEAAVVEATEAVGAGQGEGGEAIVIEEAEKVAAVESSLEGNLVREEVVTAEVENGATKEAETADGEAQQGAAPVVEAAPAATAEESVPVVEKGASEKIAAVVVQATATAAEESVLAVENGASEKVAVTEFAVPPLEQSGVAVKAAESVIPKVAETVVEGSLHAVEG
eukprot:TRINITY_DN2212_c0_g2_i3.p1 TRINITY_DN2212_c0_g2~~TRINITY_DN2212_c0_g2_i3.p1  ORF type:complete len:814 (-),score=235.64 TRINITY_DN2212_c0_g2_i3:767-3106(-)